MDHRKLVFPSNTFPYMSLDEELRDKSETNQRQTQTAECRSTSHRCGGGHGFESR